MPLLFSYGSNNPTQLGERLRRPIGGTAARLEGYGRVFRAWSKRWNGGVASLDSDSTRTTYGYVEKVTEEELKILDEYEKGYERTLFEVQVAKGNGYVTKPAIAYVCLSKTYNKPSRQYLEAVVKTINAFWSGDNGTVTVEDIPLRRNPEHPHSFSKPLAYTCFGDDLRTYWDDYEQSYRTAYTPEGAIADTRAWLVGSDPEEAKRAHYELAVDLRDGFRRNPDSLDTQIQIARREYEKDPSEKNWIRLNTLLKRAALPLVENQDGDYPCEFCLQQVVEDGCHECEVTWCFDCRYEHECPHEPKRNPSYRRNADADHRKIERRINAGDITAIGAYANSLQRIGKLSGNFDPSHLFETIAQSHPLDWPVRLQRYLDLTADEQDYVSRIYVRKIRPQAGWPGATSPSSIAHHPIEYLPGDIVRVGKRLQALSTIVGPGRSPLWYDVQYSPSTDYRPNTVHWTEIDIMPVNPLD